MINFQFDFMMVQFVSLQITAITKIQIFSETIFLVITSYGNACNAYREGRNANVLITLLGTVY